MAETADNAAPVGVAPTAAPPTTEPSHALQQQRQAAFAKQAQQMSAQSNASRKRERQLAAYLARLPSPANGATIQGRMYSTSRTVLNQPSPDSVHTSIELKSLRTPQQSREWFESTLKSPRHVCAPMVNQSELAFRILVARYNVQLSYTPMIHARNFVADPKYRATQLQFDPQLDPLCIAQFCGNDAVTLLQAGLLIQDHPGVVAMDLNIGCPQGIAKKGKYGAFLLDEWQLLADIVQTISAQVKIPITCKIRLLPTIEHTIALAQLLERSGCSLLTVHGRTRDQLKEQVGACSLESIAAIKAALTIPVLSNGGVENMNDVARHFEVCKIDGVMSSEGLLCNPALFASSTDGKTRADAVEISREYLEITRRVPTCSSAIRAHLFKFMHRALQYHTDLRELLGSCAEERFAPIVEMVAQREAQWSAEERETKYSGLPHWYSRHLTFAAIRNGEASKTTAKDCEFNVKRAERAEKKRKLEEQQESPQQPQSAPVSATSAQPTSNDTQASTSASTAAAAEAQPVDKSSETYDESLVDSALLQAAVQNSADSHHKQPHEVQ